MAVNLSVNSAELMKAYKDVLDPDTDTDWALFTYQGKTNDLKVLETGDDGLDGLSYAISDGRVQYAFARVKDTKSNLFKFVFISYCGEGAPQNRKGDFTRHLEDIKKLFKSYHVVHSARNETDMEPKVIMEKVSQASGADYSAHVDQENPSKFYAPIKPVSSVYQRAEIMGGNTRAFMENIQKKDDHDQIERMNRERAEQEQLERQREAGQYEEIMRQEEAEKAAEERRRREKKEAMEREEEDMRNRMRERQEREAEEREREQRETVRVREERLEREREREEEEREEREKLRMREENDEREEEEREEREKLRMKEENDEREEMMRGREERLEREREETEREQREKFRMREENEEREGMMRKEKEREVEERVRGRLQREKQEMERDEREREERRREREQQERNERERDERDRHEREERERQREEEERQRIEAERMRYEESQSSTAHAQPVEDVHEPIVSQDHHAHQGEAPVEDGGVIAQAMYDYDAADDTEIGFKEGDYIYHIESIDEGWWTGVTQEGKEGMFPSNYVQLLE